MGADTERIILVFGQKNFLNSIKVYSSKLSTFTGLSFSVEKLVIKFKLSFHFELSTSAWKKVRAIDFELKMKVISAYRLRATFTDRSIDFDLNLNFGLSTSAEIKREKTEITTSGLN